MNEINVNVILDPKSFRRFAVFDSLKKRRLSLAGFPAIMLAFACICFALRFRNPQAPLLGIVLALVGIVVPLFYLRAFFASVEAQIKHFGLENKRHVYSLRLTAAPDGIYVENGKEEIRYKWDEIFAVYRAKDCTYLYILENRAFLLPDEQIAGGADALWTLLESVAPADKLRGRRRQPKSASA